jgi:arylsulfatase A
MQRKNRRRGKSKMMGYNLVRLCSALVLVAGVVWAEPAQKPNVVIIYGDDVGFGDVGVYGSKMIPTPNIDRLAAEGLRFTDGHCAAATCSPSRFSMLTGLHGFRNGVAVLPPNERARVRSQHSTLAPPC